MKKVKMIVSTFAVFAVVGSALAFRAFHPSNIFCNDTSGVCAKSVFWVDVNTGLSSTTDPCGEGFGFHHYSKSLSFVQPCPLSTFTVYTPTAQ